jgi:hypothetical protein
LNQAADRVSRLLLEPLELYAKHAVDTPCTTPPWAAQFEAELLSARGLRDGPSFDRAFDAYSRRIDQMLEEREERRRQFEVARQRAAREDAERVKKLRAKVGRLRYQPKRGTLDDEALAAARKTRKTLRKRLRRRGGRATDEERAAAQAADGCRRAQARVDFAVDRSTFPRLTKRFADAHPEAAAKIRELSRQHDLARKGAHHRCHDREPQEQLMARRESLMREALREAVG